MENRESMFFSVHVLLLLSPLISPGSMSPNIAMTIEEEEDSMALLPFGSVFGIGTFDIHCRRQITIAQANSSPQDYVDAHNVARAQVGVGPIQWDEKVANYAQQFANQRINDCMLVHSGGPYGENIASGTPDLTRIEAVNLWVDEKQFYHYNTNSCTFGKVCGHYTQVVWRDSIRIGCAKVNCRTGGTFIVCNYDPHGNILGQRPY